MDMMDHPGVIIAVMILGALCILAFVVYNIVRIIRDRKHPMPPEEELTSDERTARESRVQDYVKSGAVNEARMRGRRGIGIY